MATAKKAKGAGKAAKATGKTAGVEDVVRRETEELATSSATVPRAPSELAARLQWMEELARSAAGDADTLVTAPLAPEPALTRDEIARFGPRVALLREWQGARRASVNAADPEFERAMEEARALQAKVLKGIRHVFRKDAGARRWASAVMRGEGLDDLRNDVAEMESYWATHAARLAVLNRGEKEALRELRERVDALAPKGTAKPGVSVSARQRDAAYALALGTARRVRAAAEYVFDDGDPRLAAYKAFKPAKRARKKPVE